MGSPKIVVDRSRFPVVIQTMDGGYGIEDLDAMLQEYEQLLEGGQRYALIVSFLQLPSMNAAHRQRLSAWWVPRKELVRKMNVMSVVIVENTIVRGMMTALFWLVQPVNPQKFAATFAEAVQLCVEALEQEGIPLNAAVRELRDHPSPSLPPRRAAT